MKKKIKFILLILLAILFFLILVIVILGKDKKETPNEENRSVHIDNEYTLKYNNRLSDVYKGNLSVREISNYIDIVFQYYLPSIKDKFVDKTDSELEAYFNEDEERIRLNLGITDSKEFLKFAKALRDVNCDLKKVSDIQFYEDSYKKVSDDEETLQLKVTYTNNKYIECLIHISKENNQIIIRYEAI